MHIDKYLSESGLVKLAVDKSTLIIEKLRKMFFNEVEIQRFIKEDRVSLNKKGEVKVRI